MPEPTDTSPLAAPLTAEERGLFAKIVREDYELHRDDCDSRSSWPEGGNLPCNCDGPARLDVLLAHWLGRPVTP